VRERGEDEERMSEKTSEDEKRTSQGKNRVESVKVD
jgi:hypothetical protein